MATELDRDIAQAIALLNETPEEALNFFNDLLLQGHHQGLAFFYRGIGLFLTRRYQSALRDFDNAAPYLQASGLHRQRMTRGGDQLNLEYSWDQLLLYRASCLKGLGDYPAFYQQRASYHWQAALQDLSAAIHGDPTSAQWLYERAIVYHAQERNADAIRDLTKAIALRPDFVAALTKRAALYAHQGDYATARRDYRQVLVYEPKSANIQKKLAEIEQLDPLHSLETPRVSLQAPTTARGIGPIPFEIYVSPQLLRQQDNSLQGKSNGYHTN
ncbi:tetratricopeptide repeat (TPR) domain protein (plasmid) [Picosynechococcus sp. PCC 7002]|uniref:tetratricopeptide repeat protein n=1 Tax=Picosynechococcus sp. (strain ATCC 27264 / PCC 7002 / PR-6) TaxID=32049 RepID=UPI00016DCEF4|nr:tetratricopeptide repeat protein [Picosynechococcus sp. PCC 7002]ACB00999.1 tetratricopeptide repeat (TPR) domain protein [Picosynechococcus sp. PCC 7002]